jgi:peptidoglycan/LPS O-acetylase OafA/YrhL
MHKGIRWLAGLGGLLVAGYGLMLAWLLPMGQPLNQETREALQYLPWLGVFIALLGASLVAYALRPALGRKALKLMLVLLALLLLALAFLPLPVFQPVLSTKIAVSAFAVLVLLRVSGLLKRRPRQA